MAFSIFNQALNNTFQASQPMLITGNNIVLDFLLTIANTLTPPATAARIEWYPEYASDDPNALATRWYRETSEEDIGNGDVRMNDVVRRFSPNGSDASLAVGIHGKDTQFSRKHNFCRIQIRVAPGGADTCNAQVFAVTGVQPTSAT